MPTVLRLGGLRVVIYPNDHRPAHVHVIGADGEAVFHLRCPDGPPELRECFGFSVAEAREIVGGLVERLATLCREWERIHGDFCVGLGKSGVADERAARRCSRDLRSL